MMWLLALRPAGHYSGISWKILSWSHFGTIPVPTLDQSWNQRVYELATGGLWVGSGWLRDVSGVCRKARSHLYGHRSRMGLGRMTNIDSRWIDSGAAATCTDGLSTRVTS